MPTPLYSQAEETPKYEVGAQFTSLTLSGRGDDRTEPGIGARFTYNLTDSFALEAVGNLFPRKCTSCNPENNGRIAEGLFGVKAGKRFERFGLFGKARPGFVSFRDVALNFASTGGSTFSTEEESQTNFAMDVGGVLEFYPSRRIVLRFYGGDTIIRYPRRSFTSTTFFPGTMNPEIVPVITPADTRHNFQFSAGVGVRF